MENLHFCFRCFGHYICVLYAEWILRRGELDEEQDEWKTEDIFFFKTTFFNISALMQSESVE